MKSSSTRRTALLPLLASLALVLTSLGVADIFGHHGIGVFGSGTFTQLLGGQLIDATIIELRPHLVLKDRVVMIIDTDAIYRN